MLEFIAQNIYVIAILVSVLPIIGIFLILYSTSPFSPKNIADIGGCMIMIGFIILGLFALNIKGDYPVSHAEWKTIYKNDLNADVKIAYNDFSDNHSISTNQKQNIKDFQSALKENGNVINIKLTATKNDDSITKNVLLKKDHLIAKNIDANNAKIAKIEYRPIEGTAPKVFGAKGPTSKSYQEGEIRITFKSNTNKQLEALFKD